MKPVRQCVTAFLALVVLGAAQPLRPIDSTDPARNLAPVSLFVSTRAGAVDVTVANASVASYRSSIVSGREGVRSSQTGQTLRISGNIAGELAEARFDLILSDVPSATRTSPPAPGTPSCRAMGRVSTISCGRPCSPLTG